MKKLILSAVLAVACFTAQAKNEVVSNDDKNPKNKVKKEIVQVKAKTKIESSLPDTCCREFQMAGDCEEPTVYASYQCASSCRVAFLMAFGSVLAAVNAGCD